MTGRGVVNDRSVRGWWQLLVVMAVVAATLTVASPAQAALPEIGFVDVSTVESEATSAVDVEVTVELRTIGQGILGSDLSFDVVAAGSTTAQAADFTIDPGNLSPFVFLGGSSPDQAVLDVIVRINPDSLAEDQEYVDLEFSGVTGGDVDVTRSTHRIYISDDGDPQPTISIADDTVTEGGTASFDATLSIESGQEVRVDYATSPGSASTSDYTSESGTLVFAAGETSKTVTVATTSDTIDEGASEAFSVVLSAPSVVNATILDGTAIGTITDNDTALLSVSDESASEGNSMTFDITLSTQSSSPVTVSYATANGSATAGSDYNAVALTPVTFTPGQTLKTVTVTTIEDSVDESNETFTLDLSGESGAGVDVRTGTGTINDDDSAGLSVSDPTIGEGGVMVFNVTLSTASGSTVTVNYATANGSATAGAGNDYTAVSSPPALSFTPGQTLRTVSVPTLQDTKDELDETFTLNLSGASGASIDDASGTGTITDDDPLPALAIGNGAVVEGGVMTFDVTLSAESGKTVTVNYATSNGSATGSDYTAVSSPPPLTFDPGETSKTISVSTTSDVIDEGASESFTMTLSGASNATNPSGSATGTITDDDNATLSIADPPTGVEEGQDLSFEVTLSTPSSSTVTVDYETADITAFAPGDYVAIPAAPPLPTLSFSPGQTTRTVTVTTVQDSLDEANETLAVNLSNSGGTTIVDASATGTILDDDGAPGLSVLDAAAVDEGPGTVQLKFTIVLLPMSGQTVTADYATANGTAVAGQDYTPAIGTVTFDPGETSKDVFVTVLNDGIDEIDETVLLNITGFTNTMPPADPQGVGTIVDDDNVAPVVSIQITDQSGTPGIEFGTGEAVRLSATFVDGGAADTHTVTLDWGDGSSADTFVLSPVGTRAFERTHVYTDAGFETISLTVADADGGTGQKTGFVNIVESTGGGGSHRTGLVDPASGRWRLYDAAGSLVTRIYYGNPGDYPFMGDWDGDGIETPGLYRQSDGYVYLRNSNTEGNADIKFFFGNPGDVPVAGDFNNDGFDTVSIYRPSNQTFYIINKLGSGDQGLGAADFSYVFGNPGDKPFVGDFDGDGVETVGLHRESTGLVYFRNSHTQGNADNQFIFGDPGDRLVAGDWTGDGVFTPALYRPSNKTMYFRYSNTQGNADAQWVTGQPSWLPVSGVTGF